MVPISRMNSMAQTVDAVAEGVPLRSDVLLVSHGFQINYERGFSNGLAANGLRPTLVSSDRTDYAGLASRVGTLNLRGSQEESRPPRDKALNLVRYHLRLMLHVLRRRDSIVHVIGMIEPAWLHGLLEGLLFRLASHRYVLTVHDVLPHDRHTAWNRRLARWSFKLAHRLVVHTPVMRDKLTREYGIDPARIVVMEHGIEPIDATAPAARPLSVARPRLLFFGIVKEYKGLDLLLEALAGVDFDYELRIVGACMDTSLAEDIRARMARHPHHDRMSWRSEYIAEAEVGPVFEAADMLVLPYRHIDQSGVLFQALRHGVPIVATDVGAFASYVSHDVGEICAPGDVHALAAALERLRVRLPTLARDRIRERARRYEWPTTVRALWSAYA